jgi:hypothetical protein
MMSAKNLTIDFPIYDTRSRLFKPVACDARQLSGRRRHRDRSARRDRCASAI